MNNGVFGGYTHWAVVFLIIFVLFFLLVPGYYGTSAVAAPVTSTVTGTVIEGESFYMTGDFSG